jgi:hypothetical protein
MRPLPSPEEAAEILRRRRTRPVRRPPPAAGKAVARLLRSLDKSFGPTVGPLQTRWREIVGETLWRVSEPVKLIAARGTKAGTGATLELRVDGPAAAIVQHQAADILARVNLALGSGAVSKLRVVQGLIRRSGKARPARRLRGPLDAASEAELRRSLDLAPDGPLKQALLTLGRAIMRHADD